MRSSLLALALLAVLLPAISPGGAASQTTLAEPSRTPAPATLQDAVPDGQPAFPRALAEAAASLAAGETQLAESRYRTALLEGWLLLGAMAVATGDVEGAETAYRSAETCTIETRRPRLALATLRLRTDRPEEAVRLLREIIGSDKANLAARRLLAEALASAGQLGEAIQELEELRALDPDDLQMIYALATAQLTKGDAEAGDALLTELAERRPIAATRVLIGRTYRDFGRYGGAREALEAALEMDPRTRRAHYYLGTVALIDPDAGGHDEALSHFEAELAIAPDDPWTNLYLGMILSEQRLHAGAVEHLERAMSAPATRKDALHLLGRNYLALDRPQEAVEVLRQALERTEAGPTGAPEGSDVDLRQDELSAIHYQLALALRRSGDEAAARPHFEAAQSSSVRDTETSRELMRRYLTDEPTYPATDLGASPLEIPGVSDLATDERLELRHSISRGMARAYQDLGVLQTRREHFTQAAHLFLQAASLDPELPRIHYSLGVALFNAGRFQSAVAPLERARETQPDDIELDRMLAMASLNSGRYDRAAELLERDPERASTPSLQYAYGLALVRSGAAQRAVPVFADLLTADTDWPEVHVVLGQALADQDDYEGAIRSLERAIALDPRVAEAHSTLGDIYLRQGDLQRAEKALRTELDHHPEDLRAGYTLAVVLDLANKTSEAIHRVRSILERQPGFADARYLLGKLLLAQGSPEEALAHLEAAARLAPEEPNTYYQLGLANQRLGRTEDAERAFEAFRRLKDEASGRGAGG